MPTIEEYRAMTDAELIERAAMAREAVATPHPWSPTTNLNNALELQEKAMDRDCDAYLEALRLTHRTVWLLNEVRVAVVLVDGLVSPRALTIAALVVLEGDAP